MKGKSAPMKNKKGMRDMKESKKPKGKGMKEGSKREEAMDRREKVYGK